MAHAYLDKWKEERGMRSSSLLERAEKPIPELMVQLTRLAELVSPFVSVVHGEN
jgi:hypothetical protein